MPTSFPVTLSIQKTTLAQSKVNRIYIGEDVDFNNADLAFINGKWLYALTRDSSIPRGYAALSKAQRETIGAVRADGSIDLDTIDRKYIDAATSIRLDIEMLNASPAEMDANLLKLRLLEVYTDFPFNKDQIFYLEIPDSLILVVRVTDIQADDHSSYGILDNNTDILLSSASKKLVLLNNHTSLRSSLSFEQLGIGGLKREFEIMFRRAFVQRLYEPGFIKGFGISHVKGIMLYGPPGTGKTLIARKLGSLLNARPPKIVNGPEILNKYVGQSEENIRNLFKEAEEEFRQKGENSQLHMIIFDEIDAICKRRGTGGSAGTGDQVVNQLLSKLDGVESLDNILVIGMTNRLDMIDEALLRPGRFEIHLEISLPDEESRKEIFMIHTKNMTNNNFLDQGVDMKELARLTKNYTGAEISAVVRSAISYALERSANIEDVTKELKDNCKVSNVDNKNDNANKNTMVKVGMNDMLAALDEIKPAFGVNNNEFELFNNKTFYETISIRNILNIGNSMLEKLRKTELYNTGSFLIHGPVGSGKTTAAVRMALGSGCPFVKVISPRDLVGMGESEKVNYIKDRFHDAYKSEEACIILDNLEGLVEYAGIGPRFSNAILQAIKIFVKTEEKKKLFVFGTTSLPFIMEELGIFETFGESAELGMLSAEDYELLCGQNGLFINVVYNDKLSIKRILSLLPE